MNQSTHMKIRTNKKKTEVKTTKSLKKKKNGKETSSTLKCIVKNTLVFLTVAENKHCNLFSVYDYWRILNNQPSNLLFGVCAYKIRRKIIIGFSKISIV